MERHLTDEDLKVLRDAAKRVGTEQMSRAVGINHVTLLRVLSDQKVRQHTVETVKSRMDRIGSLLDEPTSPMMEPMMAHHEDDERVQIQFFFPDRAPESQYSSVWISIPKGAVPLVSPKRHQSGMVSRASVERLRNHG